MSTAADAKVALIVRAGARARATPGGNLPRSTLAEFEHVYRDNVDVLMGYFARRCGEPQTVADLTSETFVRAAGSFASFDPRRGSYRAWLFGIASNVYARHCAQAASARDAQTRLGGRRALDGDEIEELMSRIDAERSGRELMVRCSQLPELERSALELVDLAGLTAGEAAAALGVSHVVLRKRLSRARGRLRKEQEGNE